MNENRIIQQWLDLTKSRDNIIGKTEASKTGEEFTTSGDLELDDRVAQILLNTIENRLPNWGYVNNENDVITSRNIEHLKSRNVQLLPQHQQL